MALDRDTIISEMLLQRIVVTPLTEKHLQPAGLQLSLGERLAVMKPSDEPIDPGRGLGLKPSDWHVFDIDPEKGWLLKPKEFVLGHTLEAIAIANDLLAMIDGRSTLARCGFAPHEAAMALWPGHGGGKRGPRQVTLEITNVGSRPIVLRKGLFVANVTLHRLEQAVTVAYDDAKEAKYNGDEGIMLPVFNGEMFDETKIITDLSALRKTA